MPGDCGAAEGGGLNCSCRLPEFLPAGRRGAGIQPPEGLYFTKDQGTGGVSFDQFWRGAEGFSCLGEFADMISALLDGELECFRFDSGEGQGAIRWKTCIGIILDGKADEFRKKVSFTGK